MIAIPVMVHRSSLPSHAASPATSAKSPALQFDTWRATAVYLHSRCFHRHADHWSNGTWRADVKHDGDKFVISVQFGDT
jgi:hypothetical protein